VYKLTAIRAGSFVYRVGALCPRQIGTPMRPADGLVTGLSYADGIAAVDFDDGTRLGIGGDFLLHWEHIEEEQTCQKMSTDASPVAEKSEPRPSTPGDTCTSVSKTARLTVEKSKRRKPKGAKKPTSRKP